MYQAKENKQKKERKQNDRQVNLHVADRMGALSSELMYIRCVDPT
jgi:hypothetical protein